LFINIVHQHCSSSTTAIFSSGASANHSSRPTTEKTCTSVSQSDRQFYINADHSQRSQPRHKYTSIYCLQQPATSQPQQVFVFSNPNQRYKPSVATTIDSHPPATAPVAMPPSTVPSPSAATTDQRINRPSSSSDTTDTTAPSLAPPGPSRITKPCFLRHHRQHGNKSQEVGKKETEARKIINPTTPATRHLPR
jgi:hypothetical protein